MGATVSNTDNASGTNPAAATREADWEANAYPTASAEIHAWMREQRRLIRDFLASDLGAYGFPARRPTVNAVCRSQRKGSLPA